MASNNFSVSNAFGVSVQMSPMRGGAGAVGTVGAIGGISNSFSVSGPSACALPLLGAVDTTHQPMSNVVGGASSTCVTGPSLGRPPTATTPKNGNGAPQPQQRNTPVFPLMLSSSGAFGGVSGGVSGEVPDRASGEQQQVTTVAYEILGEATVASQHQQYGTLDETELGGNYTECGED
jgi:hypothetical protein